YVTRIFSILSLFFLPPPLFFFTFSSSSALYSLSLHDALPIWLGALLGSGLGVLLRRGLGLLRLRLLLLGLLGEPVLVAVVGDAVAVAAPVALRLGALALGRTVRLLLGLPGLARLVLVRGGAAFVRCGGAAGVGAAAQGAAAVRPGTGALRGQDILGHSDLLALGGLVRA